MSWCSMIVAEVIPEAALNSPNRHLLQALQVLFFKFLCCESRFSFHLSMKHLKSLLGSLPSQPSPLHLEWQVITSHNLAFFSSIPGHCAVLCQAGSRYLYCTFLPHKVMISLQYAPLSALDLMALAHNTQKKTPQITAGKTHESCHKKTLMHSP